MVLSRRPGLRLPALRFETCRKVSRAGLKPFGVWRIPFRAVKCRQNRFGQEIGVKKRKALFVAAVAAVMAFGTTAARAQKKNEVGLVIGATVTPDREFTSGAAPRASFGSSLALGVEYDRLLSGSPRVGVYGGVDFLASPLDVKLSNPSADVIGQYAYVFLTPHVR